MQKAYLMALYDIAVKDSRVLSVLSDSGTGYDELFRREMPDRLLDFGIAEGNMVGAAAGLASVGFIPFVYTAGAFLAYRAYEFIRDDVCLQNQNVKIVGMGTGLAWSTLGPTHHTTEDLGILCALPNMTVLSPSCPREVEKCVKAAYEIEGPVYLRIGMSGETDIYGDDYDFVLGRNVCIFENLKENAKSLAVLSTGSESGEALRCTEALSDMGYSTAFYNVHTLKPFDEDNVKALALDFDYIITIEEHSIFGGLGSLVSDVVAGMGGTLPKACVFKIGLNGSFAKGYGTQQEVRLANGLDAEGLLEQIKAFLLSDAELTDE